MADEQKPEGGEGSRSIDSVVAEMNRKTSALAEDNKRLSEQLMALTTAIKETRIPQQKEVVSDDDALEDLAYKDPKAYAREVEARAARKADQIVDSRLRQQNETNTVLNQLSTEYPELRDVNSDLTKKAVSIFQSMNAAQQANPLAYKIAVRDAAADLGLLPSTKRKTDSSRDDFSFSPSSSSEAQRGPAKAEKLDPRTVAFAEIMGLNVKDDKVLKRLESRNKREFKKWSE